MADADTSCFEGDYITLYYKSIDIMFEYYHTPPKTN